MYTVLHLALYSKKGSLQTTLNISACLKKSMRKIVDENAEFRADLERLASEDFSVQAWKKWAQCNLQQMNNERRKLFENKGKKFVH